MKSRKNISAEKKRLSGLSRHQALEQSGFARDLRAARDRAGLSAASAAARGGVRVDNWRAWENCRGLPKVSDIAGIVKALGEHSFFLLVWIGIPHELAAFVAERLKGNPQAADKRKDVPKTSLIEEFRDQHAALKDPPLR